MCQAQKNVPHVLQKTLERIKQEPIRCPLRLALAQGLKLQS